PSTGATSGSATAEPVSTIALARISTQSPSSPPCDSAAAAPTTSSAPKPVGSARGAERPRRRPSRGAREGFLSLPLHPRTGPPLASRQGGLHLAPIAPLNWADAADLDAILTPGGRLLTRSMRRWRPERQDRPRRVPGAGLVS